MESFAFILDTSRKTPLYFQLYEHIKNEIQQGAMISGEKLPSKRQVSHSLKISVNTVESAYEQLEAEGYIEARDRSGFYVCPLETSHVFQSFEANHENFEKEETVREKEQACFFSLETSNVDTHFFPYNTWSKLSKNLIYNNRDFLEVGDSKGDIQLRITLCNFLHRTRGVNCSPQQIIVGAGSEYLLTLLVELLGRDKVFAMENPCYSKTYDILSNSGAKVKLVSLDDKGIDVNKLKKSEAGAVHITPSHQFPMGTIMPVSRRLSLLNWANEGERYIIEDDYDSEFRYGGRPVPALQGMDNNQRVIYLTTFSKSISPSFRLAVLVLPKTLANKYNENFSSYSSTVSRYEQHTLNEFIAQSHFERHLNKLRKIYKNRKECLEKRIMEMPWNNIEIIGANAGLHFVVQFNGKDEKEMIKQAERAGVRLNGLSQCYLQDKPSCPKGAVLMGYASLNESSILKAADLLERAWFPDN